MRIFVTRHGQVADDAEYLGDVAYPKGDMPLSELGCEQARLLGIRLKNDGFSGVIYASPFVRTMQTADIIAREVNAAVIPTPGFHEIFKGKDTVENFNGKTAVDLKRMFPSVKEDACLPARWWTSKAEDNEAVRYRVSLAMREIMNTATGDVLLVGHGASVDAMLIYLTAVVDHTPFYNCSYTVFDTATKRCIRNNSTHLPIDKITYNKVLFMEKNVEIELPEELLTDKGLRILHIGDTPSTTYPWYVSLIKQLKPDIIIHTGDTADEMKVSRDIAIREVYLDRASSFLRKLTDLCPRVIWLPGNNDLPERITELVPRIELKNPGSTLNINGIKISLAHHKDELIDGADVHFYGHSGRYEIWSPARNTESASAWYLNALWYVSLISLPEKKLYSIKRP